jgi:hypothetical protein
VRRGEGEEEEGEGEEEGEEGGCIEVVVVAGLTG